MTRRSVEVVTGTGLRLVPGPAGHVALRRLGIEVRSYADPAMLSWLNAASSSSSEIAPGNEAAAQYSRLAMSHYRTQTLAGAVSAAIETEDLSLAEQPQSDGTVSQTQQKLLARLAADCTRTEIGSELGMSDGEVDEMLGGLAVRLGVFKSDPVLVRAAYEQGVLRKSSPDRRYTKYDMRLPIIEFGVSGRLPKSLTDNDKELLQLLSSGAGRKTAARRLGVTRDTVSGRLGVLFRDWNAKSAIEFITKVIVLQRLDVDIRDGPIPRVGRRDLQLMILLTQGHTVAECAAILGIEPTSAHRMLTLAHARYEVPGTPALTRYFFSTGVFVARPPADAAS